MASRRQISIARCFLRPQEKRGTINRKRGASPGGKKCTSRLKGRLTPSDLVRRKAHLVKGRSGWAAGKKGARGSKLANSAKAYEAHARERRGICPDKGSTPRAAKRHPRRPQKTPAKSAPSSYLPLQLHRSLEYCAVQPLSSTSSPSSSSSGEGGRSSPGSGAVRMVPAGLLADGSTRGGETRAPVACATWREEPQPASKSLAASPSPLTNRSAQS